jgi:hypothetical protein
MRIRFWRRVAAIVALVAGVGVVAPVADASAATTVQSTSTVQHSGAQTQSVYSDWWW